MFVPSGASITLHILGEYQHTRFLPGAEYEFSFKSMFVTSKGPRGKRPIVGSARANEDGSLELPFTPDIEGEWIVTIENGDDNRKLIPASCAIYVLPTKYRNLRGYLGDIHSHSTASDGKQEPAYTACRARTFGLDFFALTDHWNYASSKEMIDRIGASLGKNMLMLRGEEMHPEREVLRGKGGENEHYHHYHYVSVGHSESVRDAFLHDPARTNEEIKRIADRLEETGADPRIDTLAYAEGVWKIRKAKELGGLAIFSHPYWATPVNLDIGSIEQTLADREFDAVEAISTADESSYATSRLMAGNESPSVVGVSDSHDWQETVPLKVCTFVMSEALSKDAIFDGIRSGRSIACRMRNPPELVGPFDVLDIASFYIHRVLPTRRRIMRLQGELALSRLRGKAFAQDMIDALDDDLAKWDAKIWPGAHSNA